MNNYKEELSDLEHQQWRSWSHYVANNNKIPKELLDKWVINWKPYSELSEIEKDSDRIWADKIMALNSKKISEYCKIKDKTSHDLFKLFAELTGFDIKKFHDVLSETNGVKKCK